MPGSPLGRRLAALTTPALIALAAVPTAANAAATCAAQNITVTPLQSAVFYVDVAQNYLGSYVGYRVANTGGSSRTDAWVRLEAFTGTSVRPANGAAATTPVPLDAVAAGAHKSAYAYLKASAATTADQGHDVVVYQGRPGAGGVEVCRQTQTQTAVADVIKAAANKVTGASLSAADATLGSTFSLTVSGETGTIGSGPADDLGIVRFSPAVAASWPADAFRLVGVSHKLPAAGVASPDTLFRSGLGGWANTPYDVTYTFRVVGPTAGTTPVVPVQNIASGTQVKHTDPGTLSSLAPIPAVTSTTTMAVNAPAPGPYATATDVPLTATLTNTGPAPIAVDAVVASLPAGWGYKPGSAQRGGTGLPDPHTSGQTLTFVGPHTVPANGSTTFAFEATAGAPGTSGPLTAHGLLDGGKIDATTSASDDVPASRTLTVLGPPAANDDTAAAATAVTRSIDVLANDTLAGATGTLTITSPATDGTATVNAGRIDYESAPGFTGTDTFEYQVTTSGGTDTGTVTVTVSAPPPAPTPGGKTSTGTGTTPQHVTLDVPTSGTVRLVTTGGDRVTTWPRDGVGTYDVDGATGAVTFTPVLGYTGSPAVTYEATDPFGQTGTATYTPTVGTPAGPSATARTSSGTGTAVQAETLTVPVQGSVTLLSGGSPATTVTVPGEGSYDLVGNEVRFRPLPGFLGVATAPVSYRVTDAYGQTATSTYTPTVLPPAGPAASARVSTGTGATPQTAELPIPEDGTVALLDGLGTPATSVTVLGQGTYVLDALTGVVTFTPILGFSGPATPLSYRVRDAYAQTATATYTPTVTAPGGPTATGKATTGVGTARHAVTLSRPADGTVRFVAAGGGVADEVVVPGRGRFAVDPATGAATFEPVLGFAGSTTLTYRVRDAFGQTADAVYAVTVTAPAAPPAAPRSSTGKRDEPQAGKVEVPAGASLALVDEAGAAVTVLEVPGEGEYVVDGDVIRFTPAPGFSGTPRVIRYRITDAYGQAADSTYQPDVAAAAEPAPLAAEPAQAAPVACTSRRTMTVHWWVPKGTSLRRAELRVDGALVRTLSGRARKASVDLRGKGRQTVTVAVVGRTRDGRTLSTTRTYNPCRDRLVARPLATLRLVPVRSRR